MQVSINITCDCGAKMTITPPKVIQSMKIQNKHFELNCCYCQGLVGKFYFDLEKEEGY